MKPSFLSFLLALVFSAEISADTIVLKNGLRLEADRIWEETAEIKCALHGVVIGFARDKVLRVERPKPAPQTDPLTNRGDVAGSGTQAKEMSLDTQAPSPRSGPQELLQKQAADLEQEYRLLQQALNELQAEGENAITDAAIEVYNQKVLRLNRRIARYEENRNALHARASGDNFTGTVSENFFLDNMRSWIGHGIQEFIDQWGTADDTFSNGTDRRTYLFVIRISSSHSRHVFFETDSDGIILNFKPDDGSQPPLGLPAKP